MDSGVTFEEVESDDDFYFMSNLRPSETGLPFTVYVSEKGHSRHAARVKVAAGVKAPPFVASVSVEPDVLIVAGDLDADSLRLVSGWVELNRAPIMDHWNGRSSSQELFAALKPLPKP